MATTNLLPIGDVAYNGWTPSAGSDRYAMVDDPASTPDDDSTYISATGVKVYARFGLANAGLSGSIINSITVHWRAKRYSASAYKSHCLIYIGGSYYHAAAVDLVASYVDYSTIWTTNPKTGFGWTTAEVDDLEAGLATDVTSGGGICTQLYVAVDYTVLAVEVSPDAVVSSTPSVAPTIVLGSSSFTPTASAIAVSIGDAGVYAGAPGVILIPLGLAAACNVYIGLGRDGRWRINAHTFFNGFHIVGDFENGKLYKLKPEVYTEDGTEILGTRVSQTGRSNQNLLTVNELQILTEPAVGLISGDGEDPQIVLTWSTDGGATWGNALNLPIGKIGEYVNRAITPPLGQGRNWVFKIQITDPVRRRILGAFADIEQDAD